MKQLLLTMLLLVSVFFISWGVKANAMVARPSDLQEEKEAAWYEKNYTAPKTGDEWKIDPEIKDNYIPVPGHENLFMVIDDNGKIVSYMQRTQLADGQWKWEEVNPDIPEGYEPVDGLKDVYKVTGDDGSVSYVKYIRNEDDTFCFMPVDENGNPLDLQNDADKIDTAKYIHEDGNVYALYNDDGVLMGYRERVMDDDGNYKWVVTDKPQSSIKTVSGFSAPSQSAQDTGNTAVAENPSVQQEDVSQTIAGAIEEPKVYVDNNPEKIDNGDGTYTETNVETTTRRENGMIITYETTVTNTYDRNGTLIDTKTSGPVQKGSTPVQGVAASPNPSLIAGSLDAELARVSADVSFDTAKANELASILNAQRTSAGLSQVKVVTSGELYQIAQLRAADMATYDYSSTNSPMYGTVDDMIARWGLASVVDGENVYKTPVKTAAAINNRFIGNEGARDRMLSTSVSQVAVAIAEVNGQNYIAEIFS